MNLVKLFVTVIVLVASFAMGESASAQRGGFFQPELRSVPLLDRPNRPGHFIGNRIRNSYHQQSPAPSFQPAPRYQSTPVYSPPANVRGPSINYGYPQPSISYNSIHPSVSYAPGIRYSQPMVTYSQRAPSYPAANYQQPAVMQHAPSQPAPYQAPVPATHSVAKPVISSGVGSYGPSVLSQ